MNAVTITQITPQELESLIENSIANILRQQTISQAPPQDERLSRKEVCALYKISYPTIHKHMKQGLNFEKIGTRTLFRRQDVDSYFQNKKR